MILLLKKKLSLCFKDGSKSYRVRWKDTWIHEQLISSYQYLVDEYWAQEAEKSSKEESQPTEDLVIFSF